MTGSSPDVFSFIQSSQAVVGIWDGSPATSVFLTAQLLDSLPALPLAEDIAAAAYVISRFGSRLHQWSPRGPWTGFKRTDAVALVLAEALDPSVSPQKVAGALRKSRWHLCRMLKGRTGLTFTELVHVVRISYAVTLLLETTRSIKEIAADVGYRDTRELDRQFHAVLGVPPRDVRRAVEAVNSRP